MALLKIDELAPDMKVLRDVKDKNGRLLIGKDSVLTAKHITMLRTWGVATVDVQIEGQTAGETFDEATKQAAEARISMLFKLADPADPITAEFKRISFPFVARQIKAEQGHK